MDESLQEIETELRALKLQQPAAHLLDRIDRELAAPADETPAHARPRYSTATNLNSWKWFGWRTAGLAAAVALVAVVGIVRVSRPATVPTVPGTVLAALDPAKSAPAARVPANHYQPVAATNVLYDLQDEGPAYVDGDTPARRLRYRYLDTYTWKSPRGNASLKWSVPRDEIRLVSASLN